MLKNLVDGCSLGETIMRATQGRQRVDPQQVFSFFSRCVAEGMFSRIELDTPAATTSVGQPEAAATS
jgi:hypothetical protein